MDVLKDKKGQQYYPGDIVVKRDKLGKEICGIVLGPPSWKFSISQFTISNNLSFYNGAGILNFSTEELEIVYSLGKKPGLRKNKNKQDLPKQRFWNDLSKCYPQELINQLFEEVVDPAIFDMRWVESSKIKQCPKV
ncbi:MAG: hypothetical protein HY094_09970 [Candidatus Melainabacteria bacterium]|nr:hypothetical protein [Candidatus Melainabacteria bacterium]